MIDHPLLVIFELLRDKRTAREKRIDEIKWKVKLIVILVTIAVVIGLAIVGIIQRWLIFSGLVQQPRHLVTNEIAN